MNKIFKLLIQKGNDVIDKKTAMLIFATPIITSLFIGLILVIPLSRSLGFSLLQENNIVEILTFITFMAGGVYGIIQVIKYSKYLGLGVCIFYSAFSVFLILIAMEEIAWGQWFFHFETPEEWAKINKQKETTLHNLKGMQGNTEFLRLIFGIGGLIGIQLNKYSNFKKISVHSILTIWFLIIVIHSIVDIYSDFVKLDKNLDLVIMLIAEFIELLIAGSAFLYLWLNKKRIVQKLLA